MGREDTRETSGSSPLQACCTSAFQRPARSSCVSAALARAGLGKTRSNEQQRYKFRGIDEVMNALSPLLVEHGVLIVPRMMERTSEERQTKS